ncbi:MAG: M48 family metalloprotease [Rhodothermales bacterium]
MRRRSSRRIWVPRSPKRRFGLALVVVLFAIASYYFGPRREFNPVTEETQRVSMTVEQEMALGLQAAPQMAQRHGGLHPDQQAQAALDRIGERLVVQSEAGRTPYRFEFHVLADSRTVNAFALPGGKIFMTGAMAARLRTEGELAGVLAHEIGHVVGRHAAGQMDKAQLTQGLVGAAAIAAFDPEDPTSTGFSQIAALIGQAVDMKYGRDDERQSDALGVRFMAEAGYDPRALIGVMEVLEAAARGNRRPEFFSTHPNPDRRIEQIQRAIEDAFPNGVPEGLVK